MLCTKTITPTGVIVRFPPREVGRVKAPTWTLDLVHCGYSRKMTDALVRAPVNRAVPRRWWHKGEIQFTKPKRVDSIPYHDEDNTDV